MREVQRSREPGWFAVVCSVRLVLSALAILAGVLIFVQVFGPL